MKKINYLVVLMVALVTVFTSCEKENDDPIVPEGITVEDLVGDWDFVSLEFNGEVYGDDVCSTEFGENYSLESMNLNFTTTSVTITTLCSEGETVRDYTLNDDVITLENGTKFQVLSVNTTTLELKLTYTAVAGSPVNGIYNLER